MNVVLEFSLEMRRKMVFSSYILTLPCVFLAFLTLVVFWLPADRPDRTSLGKQFTNYHYSFKRFLLHYVQPGLINASILKLKRFGLFQMTLNANYFTAMSVFGSFLVLLLILVEAAPPTASSVPVLGKKSLF